MSFLIQNKYWATFFKGHGYSMSEIPDLSGKTAMVTGANTGLGYATMVALAAHGAHVVLACRNQQKAEEAIRQAKLDIQELARAQAAKEQKELNRGLSRRHSTSSIASSWSKKSFGTHLKRGVAGISGTISGKGKSANPTMNTNTTRPMVSREAEGPVMGGPIGDTAVGAGGVDLKRKESVKVNKNPTFEFLELDLNNLKKSRDAAAEYVKRGEKLDILILNSGIMNTDTLSSDGLESMFAVNHLGHFVFTLGLMDVLRRSQPARVVCVSSFGHEFTVPGGIDFTTLDSAEHHNSTLRYGTSKLCNILFVKALARRFANEKIYVSAVNPGWVATDLQRHLVGTSALGGVPNKVVNGLQSCVATRPQDGALTQLFAATSPEIEEFDLRGRYFIPVAHEISPSKYALDEGLQEKLWEYSIKLMNEKIREE